MDIIANGIRFQVIESGSGYPVICIHGNGLNRLLWRHLAPELNRQYRTIAHELRGMGKSETVGKPGSTFTVKDHADDLHKIQCPTLLVTGEADWSAPVRDHELIAERVADSELVVVKDASHTVCEEQPEDFNGIVLEFLDRKL